MKLTFLLIIWIIKIDVNEVENLTSPISGIRPISFMNKFFKAFK